MSEHLDIARGMSPRDRAHMVAIADGFGAMLLACHRKASEEFAAKYPGVAVVRDGYRPSGDAKRYIARRRWFSIEPTMLGLQVARMIERFDMPTQWPDADDEAQPVLEARP